VLLLDIARRAMPVGMRVLCSAMIAAIATGVRWRGLAFEPMKNRPSPPRMEMVASRNMDLRRSGGHLATAPTLMLAEVIKLK
jgi:hypothetical protein